jgi:hypothetical protein
MSRHLSTPNPYSCAIIVHAQQLTTNGTLCVLCVIAPLRCLSSSFADKLTADRLKAESMSQRYTPEHKALIMRVLRAYQGDIIAASRFTGVPQRTLRDWRHQEWLARRQARSQPPQGGHT